MDNNSVRITAIIRNNIVMLFLIIAYYMLKSNQALNLLLLLVSVVYFSFSSIEKNLQSIYFLLPLSLAFSISEGGFSVVAILELILLFKILYTKKRVLGGYLICIFGLTFSQLITILFFQTAFSDVISLFINVVSLMVLYDYFASSVSDNALSMKLSFVLGVFVSGLLPIILSFQSFRSFIMLNILFRFKGLWTNPNYYGQQVNIAVAILIGSLLTKEVKASPLSLIILLFLVLFGIMTVSRSFLFILLFMSLCYFWTLLKSMKSRKLVTKLMIVVSAMIILGGAAYLSVNMVASKRGLVSDNRDLLSGRLTNSSIILNRYVTYENPVLLVFGFGVMNSYKFIDKTEGTNILNTHNTYYDVITDFGVFGLLLVSMIVVGYFFKTKHINLFREDNLYIIVILLSAFVMSYVLTDYFYYLVALSGFCFKDARRQLV